MYISLAVGLALSQGSAQPQITVYNQGFALVKEVRTFQLRNGRQSISVEDVAQQIETNSVGIRSLSGGIEVLEQNYQYDLINPTAILNKAVGQQIKFHRVLPNGVKETVTGTLVSSPTAVVGNQQGGGSMTWNGMVIQTTDGRILLNPSGEIEVSSIPTGMISKPTLLWDLMAERAGATTVELSYLTRGMTWNADYVLLLEDESLAGLKGWVTLTNNSGATFENATLKLLAGDVNRPRPPATAGMRGGAAEARRQDLGFQEEALFEYHLYTLQRPATVRNNEIKQLSLLEASGLKYTKKLILDSLRNYGIYYPNEGEIGTGVLKPQVRVEFENTKANQMGMALPAGNVKVYQRDKSGSVQMLGEDRIQHTPRDEKVSLVVGQSFDVVAERKRLNFRQLGTRAFEQTFQIELRNRKEVPETVFVLERHYGDWSVGQTSLPFEKLDANTMQYVVNLKAGEVIKVTYTVTTRW
ncbi:MAG: hypothetical protein DCC46_07505 [Armatimonadetes bacterium]|nr:MAG: hypothetical protein DCC46_07505 [Armatimonadota bacterium]